MAGNDSCYTKYKCKIQLKKTNSLIWKDEGFGEIYSFYKIMKVSGTLKNV